MVFLTFDKGTNKIRTNAGLYEELSYSIKTAVSGEARTSAVDTHGQTLNGVTEPLLNP